MSRMYWWRRSPCLSCACFLLYPSVNGVSNELVCLRLILIACRRSSLAATVLFRPGLSCTLVPLPSGKGCWHGHETQSRHPRPVLQSACFVSFCTGPFEGLLMTTGSCLNGVVTFTKTGFFVQSVFAIVYRFDFYWKPLDFANQGRSVLSKAARFSCFVNPSCHPLTGDDSVLSWFYSVGFSYMTGLWVKDQRAHENLIFGLCSLCAPIREGDGNSFEPFLEIRK